MEVNKIRVVLEAFFPGREAKELTPIQSGLINKSYRIEWNDDSQNFLQEVNQQVFEDPNILDQNLSRFFKFLDGKWERIGLASIHLVPNPEGKTLIKVEGQWWRMMNYIPDTKTYQHPKSIEQISAAGAAYGSLLKLISIENPVEYPSPISGFMDSNKRMADLRTAIKKDLANRLGECSSEVDHCLDLFSGLQFEKLGSSFSYLCINDCKISNVLFKKDSNMVKAIVDFDTAMEGSYYMDFADMARANCATVPEDHQQAELVDFDVKKFSILARSFWRHIKVDNFVPESELVWLGLNNLIWQQFSRFLADHLAGDSYYKTKYLGQNLHRARIQLALLSKIHYHKPSILLALQPILESKKFLQ